MKLPGLAVILVLLTLPPAVPAVAGVARDGQVVMGTVLTVTIVAEDRAAAESMAAASIDEARRWDDALTIWRADGELARLHERAGQGAVAVSPRLARGLAAMLEFSERTSGAFEPTVRAAPHASRGTIRQVLRLRMPEGAGGAATAAFPSGAALDPGGIGKGLALDAIASLLRSRGATAAFVDFGGSSQVALGVPPGDASGWTVRISTLGAEGSAETVHLRDASLSTSRAGATDTTPILDPRSNAPVPGPRLVTVRASSATAADAWSTALVVTGREGIAAARANGIETRLEDPAGVVLTAGFPRPAAVIAPASGEVPLENESQIPDTPDRSRGLAATPEAAGTR